jgi:hypothetical protein
VGLGVDLESFWGAGGVGAAGGAAGAGLALSRFHGVSLAIHEGEAGGAAMGSGAGGAAGAVEGFEALETFAGLAGLGAGDGTGAGGVAGAGVALGRFHGVILEIQLGLGAAGVTAGAGVGAGGGDLGGAAVRVGARAQEKPRQRARKSGRAGSMDGKGNRRVWGQYGLGHGWHLPIGWESVKIWRCFGGGWGCWNGGQGRDALATAGWMAEETTWYHATASEHC